MTPIEAAALAVLGVKDRRLVQAVIRTVQGLDTADDREALRPRVAGEPLVSWAWRCRGSPSNDEPWTVACGRSVAAADEQLARAGRLGIAAIPLLDVRYPPRLAAIPDPPPIVWVKGDVPALQQPAVAIVGSRAATPYAIAMARRLSADLAAAGVLVVSGLARGVDSAAHVAALSVRGRTAGVLGCGIDRVYPAEHKDLARDIEHSGAVVSEFPVGVPPLPYHFPLRNRIISGLATGIVVVEAPEKSGALITASAALEQGREVLVVPGPACGGRNRGGHLLIRDGATVVESAEDILEELSLAAPDRAAAAPEKDDALPGSAFTVDDVAQRTGERASVVLARLLELELSGRIQRIGGGRFVRVLT